MMIAIKIVWLSVFFLFSCSPEDTQQGLSELNSDDASSIEAYASVLPALSTEELAKLKVQENRQLASIIGGGITLPTAGGGSSAPTIATSLGVRSFREIDATFSRLTGVSRQHSRVRRVYTEISALLPRRNSFSSFQAPMQVGIFHLSSAYCAELIGNETLWQAKFPNIDRASWWNGGTPSKQQWATYAKQLIDVLWQGLAFVGDREQMVAELVKFVDAAITQQESRQANLAGGYHAVGLLGSRYRGVSISGTIFLWMCTATLASAPVILY